MTFARQEDADIVMRKEVSSAFSNLYLIYATADEADAYMFYRCFFFVTAARTAYAGTEGCYEMLVFFYFFYLMRNL